MSVIGHSIGFILLVALAIIVGMKLMMDSHPVDAHTGMTQPNSVNPATGPGQGFKY